MASIQSINAFMAQQSIAVAGVSRSKQKFGNSAYKSLKDRGKRVFAINPNITEFEGEHCFASVSDLPADVTALVISTPPATTATIVNEALGRGIKHIWIQQGAGNQSVLDAFEGKDVNVVYDQCIHMHAGPVKSIHAFHRFMSKLFGKFPK